MHELQLFCRSYTVEDLHPPGLFQAELHDAHVAARDAHCKRFATLRARLALKGFSLLETDHGKIIVHKWNITRECSGLSEVEQFARRAAL